MNFMNKFCACLLVGFLSFNTVQASANPVAKASKVQFDSSNDEFAEEEFSETEGMALSVGISGSHLAAFNILSANVVGSYTMSSLFIALEAGAGYAFDSTSTKKDETEADKKNVSGFAMPATISLGYNNAGNVMALFARAMFGTYTFDLVEGDDDKSKSFFKGIVAGIQMQTQVTSQFAVALTAGYNWLNAKKDAENDQNARSLQAEGPSIGLAVLLTL
jgi:hypothetical protein